MIQNPEIQIHAARRAEARDFWRQPPTEAPSGGLAQIRHIHHQVARSLALGYSNRVVSETFGMSMARINQLTNDPTFAGLVEEYRQEDSTKMLEGSERLLQLFYMAAEELQERLLEDPKTVSTPELLKILETMADRAGYAPVRRTEINATLTNRSERVEQIKREASIEMVHRRGDYVGGTVVQGAFQKRAAGEDEPSSAGRAGLPGPGGEGDTPGLSGSLLRALDSLELGED